MGREIRRVPVDFNWPLNKVWEGFQNPNPGADRCIACDATGYNPATREIADLFYDSDGDWRYDYGKDPDGKPADRPPWRVIGNCRRWCHSITQDEVQALVDGGRLWDFTRTPRNEEQREIVRQKIAGGGNSWLPFDNGYIPTADEVNKAHMTGFGHDAINRWILIEARAKRLGVYGSCEVCDGTGTVWPSEERKANYEAWKPYDPPSGDGWQMWQTVSEGSPVSPVFATAGGLEDRLVADGYSPEAAKAFCRSGWVPSMVMSGGEFYTNIEAAILQAKGEDNAD